MILQTLTGRMPVCCQVCGDRYSTKPCTPEQDGEESTGVCAACWPAYDAANRLRVAAYYTDRESTS